QPARVSPVALPRLYRGEDRARDAADPRRDRFIGQQTPDTPPNAAASDARPGSRVSDRRAANFRGYGRHRLLATIRRLRADLDPTRVSPHRSGATIRCETDGNQSVIQQPARSSAYRCLTGSDVAGGPAAVSPFSGR